MAEGKTEHTKETHIDAYHKLKIPKDLDYPLIKFHHGADGGVVRHGYGIIIVNKNIKGLEVRQGAENDVSHLQKIYDQYKIQYKGHVHIDLSGEEMKAKLQDFADNVGVCPVLFISIASHGGGDGKILGTDREGVTITELVHYFIDDRKMLGIPKVFILQACRDNHMEVHYNPSDEKVYRKGDHRYTTKASDVLIAYATSSGTNAYRSKDRGSWFIQKLYECVIKWEYRHLHFVELLTICSHMIIDQCHEKSTDKDVRELMTETSSYTSTLSKFLRLPGKHYS
ncbi:Caspase-3-like [Oopsacas minuta]|uniref:Caspase-3-like n=1 Tax=Oopsacas minuta TaxID=111878 RepID=A0AAV7JWB6_9METZ|nr:Caspase-3-like [Oopsacas minuta]